MTTADVGRLVLSLLTRAAIILPLHLVLLGYLPRLRAKVSVGRLKLLWLVALVPMAMFLVPDLFSATAVSGAISYAAALGAELGREVMVASSRAMPELVSTVAVGLTHVWALGVVCVAGRRIVDLVVLRVIVERRTLWRKKRGRITLRYVDGGVTSPVTYGLFSPEIIVPIDATEDEVLCRMLVMHEVTHIENRDILLRYATTFLCAVYWFYPPIFRIERELCTLSELACDAEAVTYIPSRATDYGRTLVAYSRRKISSRLGLESRLSDGGRSLLVRIESIISPSVVTLKMKRFGAILLAVMIALSVGVSSFQAMICGKREMALFEATIEVPSYLGAIRENDNTLIFTLAGRPVGVMLRLRSHVDFDAFYNMFDDTSIYASSQAAQYDGDYLRGEFTRHGRNGSFFLYSGERLGTRDAYALCVYDSPMMGLFSTVDMAKSVKRIRNYESADKLSLAADLDRFLSQ